MSLFGLSLAYLRARALNAALNLVLLALGVGMIVLLLLFSAQLEHRLTRDARGIDLVIGAKGSPLQLILSSIYHVDFPTGNVPLAEAEHWASTRWSRTHFRSRSATVSRVSASSGPSTATPSTTTPSRPPAGCGRSRSKPLWARWSRPIPASASATASSAATVSPGGGLPMASTPTAWSGCSSRARACSTGWC